MDDEHEFDIGEQNIMRLRLYKGGSVTPDGDIWGTLHRFLGWSLDRRRSLHTRASIEWRVGDHHDRGYDVYIYTSFQALK